MNDDAKEPVGLGHRLPILRQLIDAGRLVRLLEVHNGLTGLIVERTRIGDGDDVREFDGMWVSSLTSSMARGEKDTGCVDFASRLRTIDEILDVTTKSMVVDGDNGGTLERFGSLVQDLERRGCSAVIIEDKIGPKQNSLFGTEVPQEQDSVENFCRKLARGRACANSNDFMIVARIESLILRRGIDDALERAAAYVDAGCDGIMIHSTADQPDEVLEFASRYNKLAKRKPLVVVPTTYNTVTEAQLLDANVNVVIYANHLLRAAYPAMVNTCESILLHGRSSEADSLCMPVRDVFRLI